MTKDITLSVRVHIKLEDIVNLLYSAATGSRYWSENRLGFESEIKKILKGGYAVVYDFEDRDDGVKVNHLLGMIKIKKGLTVMAKKELHHFTDFISGDGDEITGDVFLQCCLFGEVLYS